MQYDIEIFKAVAERMGIPWNPNATEITIGGIPVGREDIDTLLALQPEPIYQNEIIKPVQVSVITSKDRDVFVCTDSNKAKSMIAA